MLSDFFIADLEMVKLIDSVSEAETFPNLRARRIDTIKLETLDEILNDETVIYDIPIKEIESHGAWIFQVRPKLVDSLVESDDDKLNIVANKWSKTDEWVLDNARENDLIEFLKKLKKLASQSKNDNKELFLIISF